MLSLGPELQPWHSPASEQSTSLKKVEAVQLDIVRLCTVIANEHSATEAVVTVQMCARFAFLVQYSFLTISSKSFLTTLNSAPCICTATVAARISWYLILASCRQAVRAFTQSICRQSQHGDMVRVILWKAASAHTIIHSVSWKWCLMTIGMIMDNQMLRATSLKPPLCQMPSSLLRTVQQVDHLLKTMTTNSLPDFFTSVVSTSFLYHACLTLLFSYCMLHPIVLLYQLSCYNHDLGVSVHSCLQNGFLVARESNGVISLIPGMKQKGTGWQRDIPQIAQLQSADCADSLAKVYTREIGCTYWHDLTSQIQPTTQVLTVRPLAWSTADC